MNSQAICFSKRFARAVAGIIQAARWLDAAAAEAQLPERVLFAMHVCLEEVFANIVQHGGPDDGASPEVTITVAAGPEGVRMIFEDEGGAFNIAEAPARRVAPPLGEIKPGGLGIILIKSFSNGMSYRRTGNRNRLALEFG